MKDNFDISIMENVIYGKVFHMELTANWGNLDFIGLTSIQFLGPNSELISMKNCTIQCYLTNSKITTNEKEIPESIDPLLK